MAEFKLRYENQMHVINDELRSLQTQVTRFKRERDTYKHMLESAQKTISDLKTYPMKTKKDSSSSVPIYDEVSFNLCDIIKLSIVFAILRLRSLEIK